MYDKGVGQQRRNGPPKESKGEIECRRVLKKLFNRPFNKCRPDFLRNPVTGGNFNLVSDTLTLTMPNSYDYTMTLSNLVIKDSFIYRGSELTSQQVINNYNITPGYSTSGQLTESNYNGFGTFLTAPNLWYSFTGSGSAQTVTLDLCGSSYDSSVLVYTGTSGNLTLVAANDDACGTLGTRSQVSFESNGTTTYYITVAGYNANVGAFTMNVTCAAVTPPAVANQDCATALNVQVDGLDNNSDNSFGTVSSTQPSCDLFGSIQDVWFSFQAPASGNVTCLVTPTTMTSLNFNLYSGTCAALTALTGTCNSNLTVATSEVLTGLTPGETYFVQVWSNSAEQGTFTLRLSDDSLGNSSFDNANFSYYPNPVKNTLNLSYNQEISNIEVFNFLGQKVISNVINANAAQIDMSNLSKGAYMVKVTSNNQLKTIKVIKE
jgi:hypothetical protein